MSSIVVVKLKAPQEPWDERIGVGAGTSERLLLVECAVNVLSMAGPELGRSAPGNAPVWIAIALTNC